MNVKCSCGKKIDVKTGYTKEDINVLKETIKKEYNFLCKIKVLNRLDSIFDEFLKK